MHPTGTTYSVCCFGREILPILIKDDNQCNLRGKIWKIYVSDLYIYLHLGIILKHQVKLGSDRIFSRKPSKIGTVL